MTTTAATALRTALTTLTMITSRTHHASRTTRRTLAVAVVAPALAATLMASTPAAALASGRTTPDGTGATPIMSSASLLTLEEMRSTAVLDDSVLVSYTGDHYLRSAARNDHGCLSVTTMRAITGSAPDPTPGTAYAYWDGLYTSHTDPGAFAQEALAQGPTAAKTTQWVLELKNGITSCTSQNGHHYGEGLSSRVGDAVVTIYPEYTGAGLAAGGAAVIRMGTSFGYLDLRSGSASTLSQVAELAASRLKRGLTCSSQGAVPDGC